MHRNGGQNRRTLLLGALLAALVLGAVWYGYSVGGGGLWEERQDAFGSPEALRGYLIGFGLWAPVVFFLAQAAQVVLAPVPGTVTAIVGVLVFGPWFGTALTLAGGAVGSLLLFASVRRWGRPLAAKLVGRKNFERYAGAFADEKGALLLVAMLVPFVPDDIAVAVAGFSAVSFRRFVVVLALGRLPGSAATALVAADLLGRSAGTLAMVGLVVAAVAALVLLHRERLEAWVLRRAGAGQGPRGRAGEDLH